MLAVVALQASLELFDAATMVRCVRKQRLLTGYLEHLLLARLSPHRMRLLTPRALRERGCQLSVVFAAHPDAASARVLETALARRGLVVDTRGAIVRLAPAPLYCSFADVLVLVQTLDSLLPP